MGKRKHSTTISSFKCPDCGFNMFVPRSRGYMREDNHIKDLWCPRCKETKKMTESKNY